MATPRIIPHKTIVYLVCTGLKHYLPVSYSEVLRDALRKVLEQPGILLWDLGGIYGIVPWSVIENALTPDCIADIRWSQVVLVHPCVAGMLLKYAKEFSDPTGPSEPGPSSESNQDKPES